MQHGAKPRELVDGRASISLPQPPAAGGAGPSIATGGKGESPGLPPIAPKEVREKREDPRRLLANGIEPDEARTSEENVRPNRARGQARGRADRGTREVLVGMETEPLQKIILRLARNIVPWLQGPTFGDISSTDVLRVRSGIAGQGAAATAHRAKLECGQVFCDSPPPGGREKVGATALPKWVFPPPVDNPFAQPRRSRPPAGRRRESRARH